MACICDSDRGLTPRAGFFLAALALVLAAPLVSSADVVGIGDVLPGHEDMDGEAVSDLPQFGGDVMGDIIVGGTVPGGTGPGLGGTATGQMTIDIPTDTDPLISDNGIIGGNIFGLGLARVVSLNSEWLINEQLTVGEEGQGLLEVVSGARVVSDVDDEATQTPAEDTGYDLWVGRYAGSQGFAVVDGFASLLLSGNASIGHEGFGRIDVITGARFVTRSQASIGTVFGDRNGERQFGDGYVLVDGQASRWTIGLTKSTAPGSPDPDALRGDLYVGREARGTLEIRNQGNVRVDSLH
jgi:T5SS/PEP-CTERM-associated repeat protein